MKAKELRNLSTGELTKREKELRTKLAEAVVNARVRETTNTRIIRGLRRDLARVLTVARAQVDEKKRADEGGLQ